METLNQHELFEIEVLDRLGRSGFLKSLVFGGGTMLRLCHGLPRYSVDMDFWFSKKADYGEFYGKLRAFIGGEYDLTDSKNKYFTLLYEFRSKSSPRKLKVEIRKEVVKGQTEEKIAYSKQASKQVLVRVLSLREMLRRKLLAVQSRDEIRDYFDLEFLIRKEGAKLVSEEARSHIIKRVAKFKPNDYASILGSLLEPELRRYYVKNGFSDLLTMIGGSSYSI